MRVRLDSLKCQGHGRCYDLVPDLFESDDEGFSVARHDGVISPAEAQAARLAEINCPERAIDVIE